jgi:uncharacterized membrane protein
MEITPSSESLSQNQSRSSIHTSKDLLDLKRWHFPKFKHEHPPVVNVNDVAKERLTVGQKVADVVAANMGSWRFIIIQSLILITWIVINTVQLFFKPFDQYPYILLNLALSFQAAFAAPFIMISQNRQAEKDRLTAQNDYVTDLKGEEEIRHIMEHLDHQDDLILQIVKRLEDQHQEMMGHLRRLDPELAMKLEGNIRQETVQKQEDAKQ